MWLLNDNTISSRDSIVLLFDFHVNDVYTFVWSMKNEQENLYLSHMIGIYVYVNLFQELSLIHINSKNDYHVSC